MILPRLYLLCYVFNFWTDVLAQAEFSQNVFEILPSTNVTNIDTSVLTRSLVDCADRCLNAVSCSTATHNSHNNQCYLSADGPRNVVSIADDNIVTVALTAAPVASQLGTSFFTGFMCNGNNNGGIPHLLMVSDEPTNVSVTIPELGVYQVQHLLDGYLYLQYANSLMPAMSSVVSLKGVEVTSDKPFTLYSVNVQSGGTDGTLELPTDTWGQLYIVDTHNSTLWGTGQILVVAAYNNTEVILELPSGSTETVMLNTFETYQRIAGISEPLAGTFVSANNSVAVHAGHMCANVPDHSVLWCDPLLSSVPPVDALGNVFIVPYQRSRASYSIGIAVPYDGTVLTIWDINGTQLEVVSMNKRDSIFKNFYSSEIISITSSKDILVTQYGHGSSGVYGDPSLTIIPAVSQFATRYDFAIPTRFDDPSVVSVVLKSTLNPADLQLNGSPCVTVESTSITVPGHGIFYVVYINVTSNVAYSLKHTTPYATFGAILYARNDIEEYTTVLGYNLL